MLEGLISSLLNRYLSSVVQLDRDQLVVGVWSGRLHLTQLSIRPSLFSSLPFQLVRGVIGSFELQLNWAKMSSVPVQITVRDVHVLLSPRRRAEEVEEQRPPSQWTAKEVEEWMEREKQWLLEEAFAASAALVSASGEGQAGGSASFAATFLASVVDNVQFHVERVHVCVQGPGNEMDFAEEEGDDEADDEQRSGDPSDSHSGRPRSSESPTLADVVTRSSSARGSATASTAPEPSLAPSVLVSRCPFSSHPHYSFGLVLQSLSINTTDADGVPSFVKSSGSVVYKRVQVGGLGVHWQSYEGEERLRRRYVDADDADGFHVFMSAPFVGRRSTSPSSAGSAQSADTSLEGEEERGADASSTSSTPSLSSGLTYLLRPTDASVHLQLSKAASGGFASNETKKQPRVTATLHLGAVALELNAAQFRSMKAVAAQVSAALPPDVSVHLRHAPFVSPAADASQQSSARRWWQFAIGVHRHRIHERLKERKWQSVVQARRDYNAYVPLYRSKLLMVRDGRSEEAYRAEQRRDIESRWSARTLLTWRALIEQQTRIAVALSAVKQKNMQTSQQKQPRSLLYTPIATGATVAGWVGSLFYAPAGAGAADGEEKMPEMSVSEREQLQSVLGFDPLGPIEQLISADKDAPLYYVKLDVEEVAVTCYQLTPHSRDELASPEQQPQCARGRSRTGRARMDLAVLRVQLMSAAAFIQASETSVQLEVGGLHVEDCMQKDFPHFRYLVTSSLRNAPHIAQLREQQQRAEQQPAPHVTDDGSTPRSTPFSSSSSMPSLIKVLYRHQEHGAGGQDEDSHAGEVPSQGVFTRQLSVPVVPSHLLAASDTLDLELNTLHVNWNRTTISLIVDFLNQQEEDDEPEEDNEEEELQQLRFQGGGPTPLSSIDEEERKTESNAEDEQARVSREKQARLKRRRTLPAATVAASLLSPEQPPLVPTHLRNHSTPLPPPRSVSPLAARRPLVIPPTSPLPSAMPTSTADPRTLLRVLKRKLANVSRYRRARDAGDTDTVELKRGSKTLSRLRLNPQRQRQLDEQQLAREESASVPLAPARLDGDGKRAEGRYSVVRVNASLNSFSVSLNDDVADLALVHAEISGLNLSAEHTRPPGEEDDGLAGDLERGRGPSQQQTLQLKGTIGAITVYDTHTSSASTQADSPRSPNFDSAFSFRPRHVHPSSIDPGYFASLPRSQAPPSMPLRQASRVFWKHKASDLALLSFSFSMQTQPSQPHHATAEAVTTDVDGPIERGYDASLNLRLSSVSAVISHDFFRPLITYASEGLLRQATDKAAQQARKAIDRVKEDLASRSFLFKYVVAVDNPLIFSPHTAPAHPSQPQQERGRPWTPDSFNASPTHVSPEDGSPVDAASWSDYLVLDLGRISVYNDFFLSEHDHAVAGHAGLVSRAPLERIHLSLAAVNLLRAYTPPSSPPSAQPPRSTLGPLYSESGPMLPPSAAVRRSASYDDLHDYPRDSSVHGNGVPLHTSSPRLDIAAAAGSVPVAFIRDAGHFWQSATKRKVVEDMDIQVQVVAPLAQLHFIGVDALVVHGDISTVHVNVNERLYAFFLSMYQRDIAPLLSLSDPANTSTVAPPAHGLDGGSVLIEEQWGVEQEEPQLHRRPSSSLQPIEEKDEAKQSAPPAPVASLLPVDFISVNLCLHEIFIDVRLTPADVDQGEGASHYSASSLNSVDPSHPRSAPRPLRFSFLHSSSASAMTEPAPFAHIRASTLQLSAQLLYDRNSSSVAKSEVECSVARLSVQDSRTDCAHPLFRQIVGGHKDDLSHSTTRALSKRRTTISTFSSPASSFAAHAASTGILPTSTPHSQQSGSADQDASPQPSGLASVAAAASPSPSFAHHSRLFPSQILLTPVIPKSPSRSPLPLYHRPTASLQSQVVQAPLPPTILPDLIISAKQSGQEQISVSVDFTAPRLVLSPGCLAAALRAADVFSRITDALLITVPAPSPAHPLLIGYPDSADANRWMSDAASPTAAQAAGADALPSATLPLSLQQSLSSSPSSAKAAPTPIQLQLSVHDPQVWLMADAANDNQPAAQHTAHLTTLSSEQDTAAPGHPLVHPATTASLRRSLHLPDWPVDASPISAGLSSEDEGLGEAEDDEDEEDDDEAASSTARREKPDAHAARAGPKSLSCLVLRCQVKVDATVRGDDVRAAIDVTELQALVCYRAHHLRLALLSLPPVPIFEPLHLHVDYTTEADVAALPMASSPPVPVEHIAVNLSTVDACFSFLQISTAASILHGLNRELPPDFFMSARPPLAPSSSLAFADSASPVSKPPPTFKGSVQLHTAGIELAIVNDAPGYYVPLLRFSLPTVSLSLLEGLPPKLNDPSASAVSSAILRPAHIGSSSSSFRWPFSSSSSVASSPSTDASHALAGASAANTTFAVSLTLAGSVYNSEVQQWEVLFEPWSIDVSGDEAHITATSEEVFRLTITPSAIHTLARGVDSFQTHFLPTITSLLATAAPPPLSGSAPVEHLPQASTPPRHSSAYSSPIASSRKASLFSPAEHSVGGVTDTKRPSVAPRASAPSAPSTDKASYFLVRNDTGTRLRFWNVEDGTVDCPPAAPKRVVTLDVGEQRTVELRQYIGIGRGAGGAAASGGREWLYRSPALGLCVEAGRSSGRWDGWKAIEHVSLGTAEEASQQPVSALLSLEEEQKTEESIAGLTVHRLFANRSSQSLPEHARQCSLDSVADLVSSLSSLSPLVSAADVPALSLPPSFSAEVDSGIVPDASLACRLVSGSDAEGSSAKVLVVSSSLLTVNRTFLDLDVQLLDTLRGQVLFFSVLASGQSASLPVLSVPSRAVRLMVRPSGGAGAGAGKQWQWSDNGPRLSFLRQSAYRHTTVRCQVAGQGDQDGSAASSPAHCFFARLNVFRSTPSPITSVDSFTHSSSASALPVQTSTTFSSLYPDDGVYTLAFDPPLAYKNMLGCELDYHVTLREKADDVDGDGDGLDAMPVTLTSSGSLPHKQEVHWYGMDLGISSSSVVLLSIRRASRPSPSHPSQAAAQTRAQRALSTSSSSSSLSGYVGNCSYLSDSDHRFLSAYRHHWSREWSEPAIIHSTLPDKWMCTAPSIAMRDRDGHTLHVHLDYSESSIFSLPSSTLSSSSSSSSTFSSRTFPFAGAGPGLVTSFVPYWLFNCTGLPLVVGTAGRYSDCDMGPGQSDDDIDRRAQLLLEKEDALHRDTAAEQWFTFADARRQQEKAKGLQLLLGEEDAAHVAGASFAGWHPALRTRPYEQQPYLLSYPASQLRLLDDDDDDEDADDAPLSFSGAEKNRRACIRLPNTDWSKPFSVDAVGTHGAVELEEELPSSHPSRPCRLYEFGVSVSLHPNPHFHRSKMLLIHPRVLLHNLTGHALQYRQVGTTECTSVGMQDQVAVHRYDSTLKSRLSLRFTSYGWQWCARRYGVAVDEVGSRYMRMRNHHTHEVAVLRVDTRLVQATFEVSAFVAWEQEDVATSVKTQHSALPPQLSSPAVRLSSSLLIDRHASAPYFDGQRAVTSSPSTPSPLTPPHYGSQPPSQPLSAADFLNRSSTLQTPTTHPHRQPFTTPPPPPSADDDVAHSSRAQLPSSNRADTVPYRVENYSLHTLLFYQYVSSYEEDSLGARILPYRSAPYAWDEPDGVKELVIAIVDPISVVEEARSGQGPFERGRRSKARLLGRYSLDKITKHPPVSLPETSGTAGATVRNQLSVNVFADGRVRVLRLSDVQSAAASASAASAAGRPAAGLVGEGDPVTLAVSLHLAGVAVSVVSHAMTTSAGSNLLLTRDLTSHSLYHVLDVRVARAGRLDPPITRQELLHLQVSGIDGRVQQYRDRVAVEAEVGRAQLDNQLHSAAFPVIFCPVQLQQDVSATGSTYKGSSSSSFLALSVVQNLEKSRDDLLFFPYLSVRMAKMHLNVEEQLVSYLLHFAALVSPAFSSSSPSPAAGNGTSVSSSGMRLSISTATGGASSIVSSDLVVSTASLLAAQKRRAKRAAKAAATSSPGDAISEGHICSGDGGDRSSAMDPAPSLQLVGSVKRRSTILPAGYGLRPEQSESGSSSAARPLRRLHTRTASSSSLVALSASTAIAAPLPPADPLLLYLQELVIYPIQVNVSYSASASLPSSQSALSPHSHPLRFLLRALNVTLLNIDSAPLRLSSLVLQDVFSSPSQLAERLRWHYLLQLSTGVYSLLGSSDLLGNPVGLFTSISSGLQSFFTEPAMGLAHSPAAFTSGVWRGSLSLLQHSLYGLTNTTRGVMSSLAKGLTSLTMTDDRSSRSSRRSRSTSSSSLASSSASAQLLHLFQSQSVSVVGSSVRTALSFASSAVKLVSSAADALSSAVNPQAAVRRQRPPPLFELGLLPHPHSPTLLHWISAYLRDHPAQSFYCSVQQQTAGEQVGGAVQAPAVVTVVLLSSRLLVLYTPKVPPTASPVLLHDLDLLDLISIRQSSPAPSTAALCADSDHAAEAAGHASRSGSTVVWYEQAVQASGAAAATVNPSERPHTVQQLTLPLRLPSQVLALLTAVIAVKQSQQLHT